MDRVVIASAAEFETDNLVSKLTAHGIDTTRVITGVGMTQAGIVSSRLRNLVAGRHVIFCGTGGEIGQFNEVNVFQINSVQLAPFDIRSGSSYLLKDFDPAFKLNGLDLGISRRDAVCGLGVTTAIEPDAAYHGYLETIELYAVARCWLPVARSFTAIIASTNATGSTAHASWKANFQDAATKTSEVILSHFGELKKFL